MLLRRIAVLATLCLVAVAAFGEEPDCPTSYRSAGNASQASFMTALDPRAVVARLPSLLIAAGLTMQSSDPEKGVLHAEGLVVKAEPAGIATRVTFYSSVGAGKDVLCHYAALVGSPASAIPKQDPALIARMKDDLIKKQEVVSADTIGVGPSTVTFRSLSDFTDFKITSAKETAQKRLYEISILLPHTACVLASEAFDGVAGFGGQPVRQRTEPVRADVSLVYVKDADAWHLAEGTIINIERAQ